MRDDPTVIALVARATEGEQTAWDEIVERFAPLVWSICRRFRLSEADTYDVGQNVWLRLVEYLPSLREPAALPGWLATTTRRECLRVQRSGWRNEFDRASTRLPPVVSVRPGWAVGWSGSLALACWAFLHAGPLLTR